MTNKIFCETERSTKSNEQCLGTHIFCSHFRPGRASHWSDPKPSSSSSPRPEAIIHGLFVTSELHCRPENEYAGFHVLWLVSSSKAFMAHTHRKRVLMLFGRETRLKEQGNRRTVYQGMQVCIEQTDKPMAHVQRVKPVTQLVLHDCVCGGLV